MVRKMGLLKDWWKNQKMLIDMGKQTQVDKINARLEAKSEGYRVFLDENGKMQKRRLGGN